MYKVTYLSLTTKNYKRRNEKTTSRQCIFHGTLDQAMKQFHIQYIDRGFHCKVEDKDGNVIKKSKDYDKFDPFISSKDAV